MKQKFLRLTLNMNMFIMTSQDFEVDISSFNSDKII